MPTQTLPIVLGSRSPRRRELLALLVDGEQVLVRPPRDPAEPAFDDVADLDTIHRRLSDLAQRKGDDVLSQLQADGSPTSVAAVLTADTVIVGTHPDGRPTVLGQPPSTDDWQSVVRGWFREFYFGRSHLALTAVCLTLPDASRRQEVVTTEVHFRADGEQWLDWYLATGEPLGKAGGYGLQGAGSLFVERIVGSPSNVIGLPLWETAQMLGSCGLLTLGETDAPRE